MDRFISACFLLILAGSCQRPVPASSRPPGPDLPYDDSLIHHAMGLLQDGDLVLRTGNDFISQSLRLFSLKDPTYSHGGLARIRGGKLLVYHAIGGEDNPAETLRRDPLGYFWDPEHNWGIAIYRYDLNRDGIRKLDSMEQLFYSRKVKFDLKFDLKTDDSLYCTEFIYKSLLRATGDSSYIPLTHWAGLTYVATDNLFLNRHAKLIYRATFK
ncbi:MAG TPA: hypothetical protein VMV20_02460 [Chitinophagaceae bacterium]|nr:hypothetical protein [Chitinophagaceae bacterium]